MDGSVQVFAKTSSTLRAPEQYEDEEDDDYQLLNNVESGGTLSSLFTILALFTEDVKLRYEEEEFLTGKLPRNDIADLSLSDDTAPERNLSTTVSDAPPPNPVTNPELQKGLSFCSPYAH